MLARRSQEWLERCPLSNLSIVYEGFFIPRGWTMRRRFSLALACVFTLGVSVFALQGSSDPPKPFTGKVVSIADGDTITVLLDKTQHRIRLAGIDAPESTQAFGTKSKKALADKVFGQEVKIEWKERDKYKRIVGEVYLGDRRICLEMVQEGMAWHYKQYSKDAALAKAETEAKEAKKGLWADANPIPPWDFRKGKVAENPNPAKVNEVFVTTSGKKYHRNGCKFLSKSKIPISLEDAKKKYEPCSICNPPK